MKIKTRDSLLDNVYLASPCSIPWDSMRGTERERSCTGCSRTVYNISDMTRSEAEALLLAKGTSECLKFYRRADGTIMTDDCPRALRKVRDQCKVAAKIAVGLVAFVLSLPAALAQSVQTGDTTPLKNTIQDPMASPVVPKNIPQNIMPAGGISFRPVQPPPVKKDATTSDIKTPTTASVKARIVTKHHTLPDGKKILIVTPDESGNVVRVDPDPNHRRFMDTRASEFYTKAQKAKSDKNFELTEFYLERALAMYDSQKSGDPVFRAAMEKELSAVRLKNSDGSEKSCGSSLNAK
jgi:hypothetical protein